MTPQLARVLGFLVLAAAAAAWLLLDPLPWAARSFAVFLLVPVPAVLALQARLADRIPDDASREDIYVSSAASIWILAALAMLAARFSGFSRPELRLVPLPVDTLLAAAALTTLAGLATMALGRLFRVPESDLIHFLIPRSGSERIAFTGLSVSAGIAEELVFRSFLIAALLRASGSMAVAVTVSVLVFAVSHSYQGWLGILRVAILGLLLTVPFLVTGSVYPSMIAHAALDILAGIVLARWLTEEG